MKNTLKLERARHNVSQAALAQLVGVSRQSVNAIETGKYVPSTVLALKLAAALSIKVEELFVLDETD